MERKEKKETGRRAAKKEVKKEEREGYYRAHIYGPSHTEPST